MRPTCLAALLFLFAVPVAHAKPKPPPPVNGFPVCTATGSQSAHTIASDGAGGFYAAWLDTRNSTTTGYLDLYLQHMQGDGTVAPGWPVNGLALTTLNSIGQAFVLEDGAGGALVVWRPQNQVRMQRVDANGAIHAGWPVDGKLIESGFIYAPFSVTSDGHGGAFIGWSATTNGYTVFASVTRVDGDGNPVPPWTLAGKFLGGDEVLRFLSLAPDPVDGVNFAVGMFFNAQVDQAYVRAGHIPGDGSPGLTSSLFYGQRMWNATAIGDGQGGIFTAWTTDVVQPPSTGSWSQHLDASGAKEWPDSLAVPSSTALVGDGGTGTYLLSLQGGTLTALRRGADGTPAPGWIDPGLVLTSQGRAPFGAIQTPTGFVACWAESSAALDLKAVGVMSNGALAPGWPAGGLSVVSAAGDQSDFSMLPADSGEVFVVWADDRAGYANRDLYATRIGPSSPVGVTPGTPAGRLSFAPNPAHDFLRVDFGTGSASLTLVDVRGRIRVRREAPGSLVLPVGDLPAGIYWLSAVRGAERATGRVVILH